jgi:replicative DNA helicase
MSRVTTQEAVIAKQLPHSAESERGLLGAVIMDNLALDEMGSLIDGDFFFESHRTVFRLMRQMAERRELIDLVTLNDKLQATDELVSVGGAAYLGKLIDGVPKISNISHYVKLVRDKAVLRSAIHAANHIQDLAFEGAGSAESVLDHAAQKFLDLAMQVSSMDSFGKSYRDAAAALLDSFDNRKWRPVMTGLELLDRATGGFFPGELVTVTAGTGVGKTFFAQQIRRHSCGLGLHSLYASGEMEAEHLVSREIATEASVEHWKMRRPERLSDSDRSALLTAAAHE